MKGASSISMLDIICVEEYEAIPNFLFLGVPIHWVLYLIVFQYETLSLPFKCLDTQIS